MKKEKFIGNLIWHKNLPCSIYGNPAYQAIFEDENGKILNGRTAYNASCAYGFLNQPNKKREIIYHYTPSGKIFFDYIKII